MKTISRAHTSLLSFIHRAMLFSGMIVLTLLPVQQVTAFTATIEYYHFDRQGSLLEVYDGATNKRLLSQAWSPWGERQVVYAMVSGDRSAVGNLLAHGLPVRMGYTGHKELLATNLVFAGDTRLYDARLKRFVNSDDRTTGGVRGQNRYAYVYNNPMRYTDPNGRAPKEECNAVSRSISLSTMARGVCKPDDKRYIRKSFGYSKPIPVYCITNTSAHDYPIQMADKHGQPINFRAPNRRQFPESDSNCYAGALGGKLGHYDPSGLKPLISYSSHQAACAAVIHGAKKDGAVLRSVCPANRAEIRFFVSLGPEESDYHAIWKNQKGKWMQKMSGIPHRPVYGPVIVNQTIHNQGFILAVTTRNSNGTASIKDAYESLALDYQPCTTYKLICSKKRSSQALNLE